MSDTRIHVIGIGPQGLNRETMGIVQCCAAVVTSSRFKPLLAYCTARIIPVVPVQEALVAVEEHLAAGDVAVLAGGDPLFFGIGRTVLKRFGCERVAFYPALSAMQLLCARFREPWDDVSFVSLHGRNNADIVSLLLRTPKTVVFTDSSNNPAALAGRLLAYCREIEDHELETGIRCLVGEDLGGDAEHLVSGCLDEIASAHFSDLTIMLVKRPVLTPAEPIIFGLSEEEISSSSGLLTKNEVRAATLHALKLPPAGVLWDVGAGSGSVSLEAAKLCPGGLVVAVERRLEQCSHIRENIRRFQAYNMRMQIGEAPEVLAGLPDPDRIFIGGSGGRLAEIIRTCSDRLANGGRIVINAVTEPTRNNAPILLHEAGLNVSVSNISISRYGYPGDESGQKTFNPISVMVGKK